MTTLLYVQLWIYLVDNLMSTCSLNVDYEDMKWIFSGEQDVEMSIIKVNEKSLKEDTENKN